uniref:Uncharacterized protein n=1 Tax=Candidatus Kentrum sp. FM TaxID=2126340 RepID=A0A450WQM4_9GAMM|nr:MAG: hypothetical protein BECKFM1743A_GA0114220_106755 [Candidatus Kentron sp. FM]VFJ72921.1 MAG: hypothetical protein BECKFM1743C_GA0114222_106835 [Candidatus Kentron sp. FM]VFK19352.1 MAG: hypothetical protein BECKFM1743B_GA0114221_106141 [Candidatus Kentron sp. FM]
MRKDEIITELWRNRDAYAARHHHDLAAIVADLEARQKRSGRKLVDRRKPAPSTGKRGNTK